MHLPEDRDSSGYYMGWDGNSIKLFSLHCFLINFTTFNDIKTPQNETVSDNYWNSLADDSYEL